MNRLSDELKRLIKPTGRMLKLVWFGQLCSLVIYLFIALQGTNTAENRQQTSVAFVFTAIAFVCMVASLLLRYYLLSVNSVVRYLNDAMPAWYYIAFRSQTSKREQEIPGSLDKTEQKLLGYSSRILNLQMILWGMLNSTAIIGMMLSLVLHQGKVVFYFVVPVFIIMLTQFPNIDGLLEAGLIEQKTEKK